jgi:lysozyme family protein
LFESSVNIGKSETTKFLQRSLNLLNRNQTLYEDISEDGKFGPNTKNTFFKCLKNKKDTKHLFNLLNIFQGYKYIKIGNERYIRGWLKRIKIKKYK